MLFRCCNESVNVCTKHFLLLNMELHVFVHVIGTQWIKWTHNSEVVYALPSCVLSEISRRLFVSNESCHVNLVLVMCVQCELKLLSPLIKVDIKEFHDRPYIVVTLKNLVLSFEVLSVRWCTPSHAKSSKFFWFVMAIRNRVSHVFCLHFLDAVCSDSRVDIG